MGAWEHGPLDNDSAQEWLDGFTDHLAFTLNHAFWSRWQEEGIAAAYILSQLPKTITNKLGPYVFNEALEVVEQELKPENLKPWKRPVKRESALLSLRSKLKKLKPGERQNPLVDLVKRHPKVKVVKVK